MRGTQITGDFQEKLQVLLWKFRMGRHTVAIKCGRSNVQTCSFWEQHNKNDFCPFPLNISVKVLS